MSNRRLQQIAIVVVVFCLGGAFLFYNNRRPIVEEVPEATKDILMSLELSEDCITRELDAVDLFQFWNRSVSIINNCGNARGFNITTNTKLGEHLFQIGPKKGSDIVVVSSFVADETQLKVFIEDDMDDYNQMDIVSLELNRSDDTMLSALLTTILEDEDKVVCQLNVVYPPDSVPKLRESWLSAPHWKFTTLCELQIHLIRLGLMILIEHGMIPLKAASYPASMKGPARIGTFLLNVKDKECQQRYLYY